MIAQDLYAYALGSMIYADAVMLFMIVMFSAFGTWG